MEKTQNKSNNGQVPGKGTAETTKMVAVGKSKNESFLNIKKVFKRNEKPTLKNMRIPEVLYHFYGIDALYHRNVCIVIRDKLLFYMFFICS